MSKRRVVITGVGLVTPVGIGTEETWKGLIEGRSGIGPITHFDASNFATKFAGEVKDLDPTRWMTSREAKQVDLFIQYAIAAGAMAMEDSKLEIAGDFAERVGCYVGAGLGGLTTHRGHPHHACRPRARGTASRPFFVPQIIINLAPGQLSIRYGAKGPNMSHVSACSTSAHAIGEAARAIQHGDADAMICGGAEATITPLGVGGFNSHAGAVDAQRGAHRGLAPVRQRPRRLRHRRGRGHRDPRGAGARPQARGEDLRRGGGLRRQRRRPPHHRARRRRARGPSAA